MYVKCALWGFNGGNMKLDNLYLAIHVGTLHQSNLGIFKMIVNILWDIASIHPRQSKLKELDRRVLFIKKNCWFPSFGILSNEHGDILFRKPILLDLNIKLLCKYIFFAIKLYYSLLRTLFRFSIVIINVMPLLKHCRSLFYA